MRGRRRMERVSGSSEGEGGERIRVIRNKHETDTTSRRGSRAKSLEVKRLRRIARVKSRETDSEFGDSECVCVQERGSIVLRQYIYTNTFCWRD